MLRGRLVMQEQIRLNRVRLHRFYTRRDEFTADVLENQLLKAVVFQLSRLASTEILLSGAISFTLQPISQALSGRIRPTGPAPATYTIVPGPTPAVTAP